MEHFICTSHPHHIVDGNARWLNGPGRNQYSLNSLGACGHFCNYDATLTLIYSM